MTGYTIINNDIFDDENLDTNELAVLLVLIRYYNKSKGYAYPSYDNLKQGSKIKTNARISRTLKSLEEKEYIKKEVLKGKGSKYFILKGLYQEKTEKKIKKTSNSNIKVEDLF